MANTSLLLISKSRSYGTNNMNFTQPVGENESPYKPNIKAKMEEKSYCWQKTGILYDTLTKSSVSSEGPTWWHVNEKVPVNTIKKKRDGMQTGMDMSLFNGAAGMKTGAMLDDTAESSDAPDWMMQLPGVPRPPPPKVPLGQRSNFGRFLKGAAGRPTGAVLDDTAESGDAPRWMRQLPGVERSKDHRKPITGRDFSLEYKNGDRFGKPTHAVADDSAVSGDARSFFTLKASRKGRL